MSILHVFAHYGEGQSFVSGLGAKRAPVRGCQELYEARDSYLLFTGEGEHAASVSLAAVLACKPDIESVYNWGVVGQLRPGLAVGDLHAVRTVYAQKFGDDFRYHSFALAEEGLDLISAVDRVLDKGKRQHLGRVAEVVDMELWGLCSVAKRFSLPIRSFKIVSDEASGPVCDLVREQASTWSDQLYRHCQTMKLGAKKQTGFNLDELGLYMTQSQRQRLSKLIKRYQRRETVQDLSQLPVFSNYKELAPKKRTAAIIAWFESELQPIRKQLSAKVQQAVAPLRARNLQVQFDPSFEQPSLKLQLEIGSNQDKAELVQRLSEFDFKNYQRIFEGESVEI